MSVRSFSLVNPMSEDGTTNERRFGVFCNWVTAVAHLADEVQTEHDRKHFDVSRWRSVRPWLSYSELHNCYLKFLSISIGSMQCGPVCLTNEQVNTLVLFERRLCNRRSQRDIVEIILQLYRKTATRRTQRSVVFKDINAELVRRGLRTMYDNASEWLCALKYLGDECKNNNYHSLHLERILPSQVDVANVLLMYYTSVEDVEDTEDTEDPFDEISEYFRARDLTFTRDSLSWQAVRTKYPHVRRIPFDLEDHVLRWYTGFKGYTKTSEIIDVVNFSLDTPIAPESLMWTHVFNRFKDKHGVRLVRKAHHDYRRLLDEHFEVATTAQPLKRVVRQCRALGVQIQMPFLLRAMKRKAGYRAGDFELFLRKKQPVHWNWVARTYLQPGNTGTGTGTGTGVVSFCNFWLRYHGYEPYAETDPVWEFAKHFSVRRDVVRALSAIRDRSPQQFLAPPILLPKFVGTRQTPKHFAPYVVQDTPVPLHPKRMRLKLNRTHGWSLNSKSLEWKWALSIRPESEAKRPRRENIHRIQADYHNPNDFILHRKS